MMPDSQAYTKVSSIISARTTAKKSLMKIHRNIHEQPVILLLNPAGHHAEQYESRIIKVITLKQIDPILIEVKEVYNYGNRSSLSYDS